MLTKINNKFLEWFYQNPTTSIHIRELARKLNISPPYISKLARKNKEIIEIKKVGNLKLLKAKWNEQLRRNKQINNLKKIYDSGIIEYLEEFYYHPEYIVLFGSFANGSDHEKSDIDIIVKTTEKRYPDLDKFENFFGKEIQLIPSVSKINKELKHNLDNGITLNGFLS